MDLARYELLLLRPIQIPGKLGVGVSEAQVDGRCAALPRLGHEFGVGRQVDVGSEDIHGHAIIRESDGGIKQIGVGEVDLLRCGDIGNDNAIFKLIFGTVSDGDIFD